MILTKMLCRVGWHDKIRAVSFYFDEQGRPVKAVVITCHDCNYFRQTDEFVDPDLRPKR